MNDIENHSEYLTKTRLPMRLSCRTESGWPVVLSLWYLYDHGEIYCAAPRDARVVTHLTIDPRCAFEIAGDLPPYCGIRGQAKARIDDGMGAAVLERLLVRYVGGVDNSLARKLLKGADREVAMILTPVNCFHWDFSERMGEVREDMMKLVTRVCPD